MGRRAECANVARGFGSGAAAGLCVLLALVATQRAPGGREARRRLFIPAMLPLYAPNEGPRKDIYPGCLAGTAWQAGRTVDRVGVLHTVNADLPSASQTGPDSAILLGHSPAFSDEALVPAACEEVVVIAQQDAAGRCLLLAESSSAAVSYHVTRHRRSMQTNTWEPVARTEEARLPRPGTGGRKRAQSLLFRLLSGLKSANAALEPLLRDAARSTHASYKATASPESKGAVLLMCINSGNLDLLLNFLRSTCDRGIDVGNLVVFAADAEVEVALRFAGIRTFSHDALGTFTSTAARSYGDHTFVEIMWLKSTCVYLVNALGYDLIFQDADLFWWSDPWPILAKRPELDTAWMDDGARTTRFAPHFMNTGFYLVRANRRTQLYTAQMLGHHDIVLAWQSHQAVVSQLAAEAQALHGMTVQILDQEAFASGKQLHHNKQLFQKIREGTGQPVLFHMCWTAGKVDKLKYLKQENLWYLPAQCTDEALKHRSADGDARFIRSCAHCNSAR